MIIKLNRLTIMTIILLLFPVVLIYGKSLLIRDHITVPIKLVSTFDFNKYDFNVEFKYGKDSLQNYLQNQYVDRFYRETEIEYSKRMFVIIEFDRKRYKMIYLFVQQNNTIIDSRLKNILRESICELDKDWIFPSQEGQKPCAAMSVVKLY